MEHAMDYPRKPAEVAFPIIEPIRERWSPLAFGSRPVEQEKIQTFFEAARWAPSSYNEQPWAFVYATKDDGEQREQMESLLAEGNSWAKNASILFVSFAKKDFAGNGKLNRHAEHDTGCATGYLFLQLASLGLIGHEMAGFNWEKALAVLHVPEGYQAMAMMAIGYPGDPSDLSENLRQREEARRERNPQHAFVFRGQWPEPQ